MSGNFCPHCKKPVYDEDALLCLYCGGSLERGVGLLGGMKYFRPRLVAWAVTALVLVVFLAWALRSR